MGWFAKPCVQKCMGFEFSGFRMIKHYGSAIGRTACNLLSSFKQCTVVWGQVNCKACLSSKEHYFFMMKAANIK